MIKLKKKNKKDEEKELKEYKDSVLTFFNKKKRIDLYQKQFNDMKKAFYNASEDFFSRRKIDKLYCDFDCYMNEGSTIAVTRIQPKTIKFNTEKLEKKLGKKLSRNVIKKTYIIDDIESLVRYLKSCGVEAKIFKSFISVESKVDQNALNNLYDLGKIDLNDIKDCYTVKAKEPYFTVKMKKKMEE